MKKFIIEKEVWSLFPELNIAVLVFKNVENIGDFYKMLDQTCDTIREEYPKDSVHPYVETYKEAMRTFKKKKGAKASIDAMITRIIKGNNLGSINTVVDIYNTLSLRYLFTCGGEDLDKISGNMVLGLAVGDEAFVALGDTDNKPPREGELIYKDDLGAVVRGWLWREADRTKITVDSKNILLYMEMLENTRRDELTAAVDDLRQQISENLGGSCSINFLSKESPECIIEKSR